MINLNYHHLYYFWTVARLGSISAAARELNLAQPTLSAQIAQLERRCGKRLLTRAPSGARPTPEGEVVLRRCRVLFETGRLLEADIAAGLREAPLALRIGAHGAVPRAAVLRTLDAVHAAAPRTRVILADGAPEALTQGLACGRLDLALAARDLTPELGPEFVVRAVGSVPLVFAAAPTLARRAGRFPRGMTGLPLLLPGPESPVAQRVERFLKTRGAVPEVETQADDAEILRALALAGRGVAALELPSIRADLDAGRLVRLHAGSCGLRVTVWLAAPDEKTARPGLGRILRELARFTLGRDLTTDGPRLGQKIQA